MSIPSPQLHIYQDGYDVAETFAHHLSKRIAATDHPFYLALSGGSTPKLLFQILVEKYADKIDWKKVHLFWGDERMVPYEDEQSNYGEVKKLLLDHIQIPEGNVLPVPTMLSPVAAAKAYGLTIEETLETHHHGLPVFDLVMLGMGDDGHTASIFPHQMELMHQATVCAVAVHPESGQKRVSLTGPVINAAREVCFLVTGSGKTKRVAQILNKEAGYTTYPAAQIQPTDGTIHWFLDKAAAADLK